MNMKTGVHTVDLAFNQNLIMLKWKVTHIVFFNPFQSKASRYYHSNKNTWCFSVLKKNWSPICLTITCLNWFYQNHRSRDTITNHCKCNVWATSPLWACVKHQSKIAVIELIFSKQLNLSSLRTLLNSSTWRRANSQTLIYLKLWYIYCHLETSIIVF